MLTARPTRILALAVLLFCLPCAAQRGALSDAQLLVDLARDHGLSLRGQPSESDERLVRALLAGALRLEPGNAAALDWSHEMSAARGEPSAATLLEKLAAADRENDAAFRQWLRAGPAAAQTLEQRRAWLGGVPTGESPHRQALAALASAELALARMDRAECARELERARRLWPELPGIAGIELAALPSDAPPAERLRVRLRQLRERPYDVELAWDIARALDALALPAESSAFYEHAQRVFEGGAAGRALPTERLLDLAEHALRLDRRSAALELARQAHAHEPLSLAPGFLLHWLLVQSDRLDEAQAVKAELAERVANLRDPGGAAPFVVAEAAWFHCLLDPNPAVALKLAQEAARRAPADRFVQRVLGFAQADQPLVDAATATLAPLARDDAFAAARLARLAFAHGDAAAAERALSQPSEDPAPGPGEAYFRATCESVGFTPERELRPAQRGEVTAALEDFDPGVLEAGRALDKSLLAEIEAPSSFDAGAPWWVTFRLTNRGRYPVVLGPQTAVNPVFLVSVRVEGDGRRDYPHLFTVNLDSRLVLAPGEAVAVRRTIDVGPLRRINRRTPQAPLRITLSAIFDPVQSADGAWRAARPDQLVADVAFARGRIDGAQVEFLLRAVREGNDDARFAALGLLGDLLGEAQRLELGRVAYPCAPVPRNAVQGLLRAGLESGDWRTRSRTLEALHSAGLDRELFSRAEACLQHEHWLVRMSAVRLLTRQGRGFLSSARKIAESDSDELVRAVAGFAAESIGLSDAAGGRQP